jgi:phospholipase A1
MKYSNKFNLLCCSFVGFFQLPSAHAGNEAFALCAKNFPNQAEERLKCFDNVLTITPPASAAAPVSASVVESLVAPAVAGVLATAESTPTMGRSEKVADSGPRRTYLTRLWNLDNRPSRDQSSLDRLQLHKQNYLIFRKTDSLNRQPSSPNIDNTVKTPSDLDMQEAKYLLSFKTSMYTRNNIDLWGFKTFRLWGGYTQQSSWQILNARNSSPFRETNYEPEVIAAFATGNETGFRLFNLGLVHQSNGKAMPESRSWNRAYAQGAWEWDNLAVLARGWWRIPENALKDDNPDIIHYMGRGDVLLRWEPDNRSQSVAILLRNNLNINQNLGFMQFDWSMPVALGTAARMHAQITSGYGESLIDYNHRQSTFGLGFSFREW